jgi:predicted acyl esterase
MKHLITLTLLVLVAFNSFGQGNGQLDELKDFSTSFTYEFTTSDGVKLATDLYLPITSDSLVEFLPFGEEEYPIVIVRKGTQLMIYDSLNGSTNPNPYQLPMVFTRTPYNKGQEDALAMILNMMGYAYTLQDMRGRYQSEGVYLPMYSDSWTKDAYHPNQSHVLDFTDLSSPHNALYHEDGKQSIDFLQDSLVWDFDLNNDGITDITDKAYNGYLAMFGASALGNSQYQAAAAYQKPEEANDLKAMVPIVATLEYFDGVVQQNGAFRQALINNWMIGQMEDVAIINPNDDDMQNNIHSTFDFGSLTPDEILSLAVDQFSTLPDENGFSAMYPNYLLRSDMDGSYAPVNANGESDLNGAFSRYENLEVPMYHLSGWWDIFTEGQIKTWQEIMNHTSDENQEFQKLVIGPWTHGTIGMDSVGDLRFPESVFDINILYGDITNDPDNVRVDKIVESEVLSWLRDLLNYTEENYIAEPKVLIPESDIWQEWGPNTVRIPSENYYIRFSNFVNYITGYEDLIDMPVQLQTPDDLIDFTIDIAADTTAQTPNGEPLNDPATPIIEFENVKNVRFYVPGPVNDGIGTNENTGNYWLERVWFPIDDEITEVPFYFNNESQEIHIDAVEESQESISYVHNPDNPVQTIGGGNLTLYTPVIGKTNAGPLNLAHPEYAPLTMDREDVISYVSPLINDSLCMIGYPKMKLFASTEVEGGGLTDTDFNIRIVDVYPDGREFYVSEGVVNGRAREYAKSIYNGSPNDEAVYSNLESGTVYELDFQMMPIAYTFGHQHRIKILVSSSNYPRYQSNPNLPIEEGEFFRRDVDDGQEYEFNGVAMSPRSATQQIFTGSEYPTQIILPIFGKNGVGLEESISKKLNWTIYPNPTNHMINIRNLKADHYQITVYSINGTEVLRKSYHSNFTQIDLQNLNSGVYFIELMYDTGKKEVQKLIVQP